VVPPTHFEGSAPQVWGGLVPRAWKWPTLARVVSRASNPSRVFVSTVLLLASALGCSHGADQTDHKSSGVAPSASGAQSSQPPSFLRYPGQAGAIEPWVQEQVELADAAHLRVLVYVGASWCEPCQRFHRAVERGELNGALNGLRFLEFDQDRDANALRVAGYLYQYIPVLALPDPDGKNHGRMISGSIKGPDAVRENLVPRLQALLSGSAVD
jgi:thiol-disulfide isomerase/thioredoxin